MENTYPRLGHSTGLTFVLFSNRLHALIASRHNYAMHQRTPGRRYDSQMRKAIEDVNKSEGQGRLTIRSAAKKYGNANSTHYDRIIQARTADASSKTHGRRRAFSDQGERMILEFLMNIRTGTFH